MKNKKIPILSGLMSLLIPGIGQLYNGQNVKGLIYLAITIIVPTVFLQFSFGKTFIGFVLIFFIVLILRFYFSFEAYIESRKQNKSNQINSFSWKYCLALTFFVLIIGGLWDVKKTIGLGIYSIPSSGNSPTLLMKDYVLSDLNAFKEQQPDYGDLIVFKDSIGQEYIYRIAGKSEDTIEIRNNSVLINGVQSKTVKTGKQYTFDDIRIDEYMESYPNKNEHKIGKFTNNECYTIDSTGKIFVPKNQFYVLGDNRCNAADSRVKGFIPKENIKGKILFILYRPTTKEFNIQLNY